MISCVRGTETSDEGLAWVWNWDEKCQMDQ